MGQNKFYRMLREERNLSVVQYPHRLGRSIFKLVDLVGELDEAREASSPESPLSKDLSTPVKNPRFFFHVMASLVEMERC